MEVFTKAHGPAVRCPRTQGSAVGFPELLYRIEESVFLKARRSPVR